ncbi:MAG: ribonuclease HII [Chloroflexi bacterium]|nr:ribonuclease HII [Chloroflexota bacterium]
MAGLDEAGRGSWAGPVAAAVAILPPGVAIAADLAPVRDSKLLSPRVRERCFDLIVAHALDYGVGMASAEEIDRLGILPCTRLAMQRALAALRRPPEALLVDALRLPQVDLPQEALVHGDRLCLSIAAASILAKVSRDRLMQALDDEFPGYGLARHKGYGTRLHQQALRARGSTPLHRHSFAPVRAIDEAPHD